MVMPLTGKILRSVNPVNLIKG